MAEPHLDHPGEFSWFAGHGPLPVLGDCPHHDCRHNNLAVIGWGPDLRRYELVKCTVEGQCEGRCRAWINQHTVATTTWLQVDDPTKEVFGADLDKAVAQADEQAPAGEYVAPRVGPRSDEHRSVCVYSSVEGAPQCGDRATVHVMVEASIPGENVFGLVGLVACDQHAPVACAAGRLIAVHSYAGDCGMPGSTWSPDSNACVVDDGGAEPATGHADG